MNQQWQTPMMMTSGKWLARIVLAVFLFVALVVLPTRALANDMPPIEQGVATAVAQRMMNAFPPVTTEPPPPVDPWPDIPGTPSDGTWDRMAQCESNGNWSINTGNGYYGGLQFALGSWRAVGGTGYPHHATRDEQIYRADKLWLIQGWGAWPGCSRKLGLR